MDAITSALATLRVVPVVVLEDASDAEALGAALKAGGLPCAEVTFRTAAAEEALRAMARHSDLLVGAGTVLQAEQVDRALDAGARSIVTPGFSRRVVERCQARGVVVYPGVATATKIQMALEIGITIVKFFPAEASGGSWMVAPALVATANFAEVTRLTREAVNLTTRNAPPMLA